MTLTDFLLARIAEDEAWANDALMRWPGGPARVLAECEAKRRIVDWAAPLVSGVRHENEDGRDVLCLLALPYADRPDYRQEWRP